MLFLATVFMVHPVNLWIFNFGCIASSTKSSKEDACGGEALAKTGILMGPRVYPWGSIIQFLRRAVQDQQDLCAY